MTKPEIETFPSPEALAAAVAGRLVVRLAAAQAAGRTPAVGLTGGTIAVKIHEAVVAASEGHEDVDWSSVDFWWGDERYVPAHSDQRNDGAAARALLDKVGADPARVHPMPASDQGYADVHEAAAAYAGALRAGGSASGQFDLVLLGLGPDGHVASLMPGMPQLEVTDAIAVGVTDSPNPPPERISLTFPALNRTREVWFLVSGDEKAEAVARALADDGSVQETPARGMHCPNTTWWLDRAATSRL